jgi:tellurite resistance protein
MEQREGSMSRIARSLAPGISHEVHELRSDLLRGAMATGALVAMADRRLALEETLALGSVIENLALLKVYDPEVAISLYSDFAERMRHDYESGRRAALDAVGRCAGDIAAAELLVKVGIAIAKADSDFSPEELDAVHEVCDRLGIDGLDPLALAGIRRRTHRAH